MNEIDRKIMITLLTPQKSMYELATSIEKSRYLKKYPKIRRHVKKLEKDGLIATEQAVRKDGELDKRNTERLSLTLFGLATLILKENLNDKELLLASERFFSKMSRKLQSLMIKSGISGASILRNVWDRVKPKINLDDFNQKYFEDTFLISTAEYLHETYKKASVTRKEKIKKESIPKVSNETISLLNEILGSLKKEQRKFTRLISDLTKVLEYSEKSR